MKTIKSPQYILTARAAAIALGLWWLGAQSALANTNLWIGVSGTSTTTNWSDTANWSVVTGPGTQGPKGTNDIVFGDIGGAASNVVNSVVDNSSQNPFSLTFTNNSVPSSKYHTILIPAGVSTTNANGLTVGIANFSLSNYMTWVGFTGGGSLVQNGTNMTVDNSTSSSATAGTNAILDLSGLSNFVASALATLNIAGSGSEVRGSGRLNLAATNNITATNITMNAGSGNAGIGAILNLGIATNNINVGTFVAGQAKGNSGLVQFVGSAGGLRIRGVTGADSDRSVTLTLGDRNNTGSGTTAGQLLFNGHFVDIKATTMTLGQDRSGSGANTHAGSGTVQFDTGTIDVTTINMAISTSAGTASSAAGAITVGGTGTLVIGSGGLSMGNKSGGSTGATGTLTVSNGTVSCSGSISKANSGAVGTISITNGTLIIGGNSVGTLAVPIDTLSITNATFQLVANPSVTNIVVSTLNAGGTSTTNIINITSVPGFATYPASIPLIKFTTLNQGAALNIGLSNIPSPFTGYITNVPGNTTIDLVLIGGAGPIQPLTWTGQTNGMNVGVWDVLNTTNWVATNGAPQYYQDTSPVTFDDSAPGTTSVSLEIAVLPGSTIVSNSALSYTIGGAGKISGGGFLTKDGNGTLTLNSANDYTGNTFVFQGAVVLQNNNALGSTVGNTQVGSGGVVQVGGGLNVPEGLVLSGTGISNGGALEHTAGNDTWSGGIAVSFGSTSRINSDAGVLTLSGGVINGGTGLIIGGAGNETIQTTGISGTGTVTKDGAGTNTMTVTNACTGKTFLNQGTWSVSADLQLGAAPGSATDDQLTFNGGTLQATAGFSINATRGITLNSSGGTIEVASGVTLLYGPSNGTTGGTAVHGTGRLFKNGPGQLSLNNSTSGGDTYDGIDLNQGTVGIRRTSALGANAFRVNGSGALVTLDGTSRSPSNPFIINGDIVLGGLTTGNLTMQGATTISNATRTITVTNVLVGLTGVIDDGGHGYGITKAGATNLTLGAINTYSGPTTINAGGININSTATMGTGTLNLSGGTLNITADRTVSSAPVGNAVNLTANSTVAASQGSAFNTTRNCNFTNTISGTGGTLTLRNIDGSTAGSLFDVRFSAGGFTFNQPIALGQAGDVGGVQLSLFNPATAGDQTFTNVISGPGLIRRSVTSGTGGNSVFTGSNTFSGGVTLNAGGLGFGIDSALPTFGPIGTGGLTNGGPGSVYASGGAHTVENPITINSSPFIITGASNLTLAGAVTLGASSRTIQVDNTGASVLSGVISSSGGGLTKTGNGTLTLKGANNYTGTTTISNGSLALGTGGSIATSPTIAVSSGATFDVSAISFALAGTQTIYRNDTLAAAGNVTGNLDMSAAASQAKFEAVGGLTPAAGKFSVSGDLTLNGNTIVINVSGAPLRAGSFRLLDCAGTISGSANANPTVTGVAIPSGLSAAISTTTGSGGHIDLVVTCTAFPTADAGPNKAVCAGGSVQIGGSPTASGGTGPYVYSWSPTNGLSDPTVANPSASPGTTTNYTVTVTDTNGCGSGTSSVTITVNPNPTITLGANPVVCSGATSANLPYSATTGSPDQYSIIFDGAAHTAGFVDVSLATLPASPIVIAVPGGAAPATYNGTLTVTISNTACSSPGSNITVTVNPSPTITPGASPSVCAGTTNASLSYSATTGSPDQYSILFDTAAHNAGFADVTLAAMPASPISILVPSGAAAATYNGTLTVTISGTGCTSPGSNITVTVNPAASISSGPSSTAVCTGSSATFSVLASGGSLNYAWRKRGTGWGTGHDWNFFNSGGSLFFGSSTDNDSGDTASNGGNDINSGNGKAWAIFNNGGVSDATRTFSDPLAVGQVVSIDMDNGNIQNGGTNGFELRNSSGENRLGFFFAGGESDYTVRDSSPHDSGISFTRTGVNVLIRLTGTDSYSITIKRYSDNATATLTGTLGGTAGTSIDRIRLFNANGGDCGFGCNDFTLYFNNLVAGANDDNAGNYTAWNSGDNFGNGPLSNGSPISGADTATLTINPATAGNAGSYDVVVWNTCGQAPTSSAASLTVNPLPTSYTVGGGGAYCSGGSGVTVTLSGSDAGVAYLLQTNGAYNGVTLLGNGSALSFNNQTTAGTYTVLASNTTTTCAAPMSGNATVTINPLPVADAGPAQTNCAGSPVIIGGSPTASGGSGSGYTYAWSPATGLSATNVANPTATPASTTTYSVTVTDGNGCVSASSSVTVTINPLPVADAGSAQAICTGGSVMIGGSPTASGGSGGGYSYAWSPATGLSATNVANPTASPTTTTTYSVTVTDGNGCVSLSSSVMVTVNPLPVADAGPARTNCAGSPVIIGGSPTASGGSGGGYTYAWSPATALSSTNVANPTASPVSTTTYTVTVKDGNGCVSVGSSVTVTANPLPVADAGSPQTNCAGGSAIIGGSPTASGGSGGGYTYAWSPATGLSATNVANPTASPASTTTYSVTVTDGNGCVSVNSSVTVTVNPLPVADAGPGHTNCSGTSVVIGGSPTASGGSGGGYSYSWSPATALSATNVANPTASPTTTTTYTVTVTDGNGCISASSSVTITVEQSPLKWVGGNGSWDFVSIGLWQDSLGVSSRYCDDYDILLDDSASTTSPTISLGTTVAPNSLTNNSTKSYTIAGTGKISGTAGLTKLGSGTLDLRTVNDFRGLTTVANGKLLVNGGLLGSGLVNVTGGTLGGTGAISGPVVVSTGGTVAPGDSIGTLAVSNNLTLLAGSFTSVEINKTASTSDKLVAITNLTYGGTLQVANLAGTLASGDAFKLFDAQNYSGAFASLSPATPGPNLLWDTNTLSSDGTLRIVLAVNTNPTNIVAYVTNGNQLVLNWPQDHTGWRLQGQTNDANVGLSNNWTTLPGSAATNRVIVDIDQTKATVFYRMIYP